MNRRIKVLYIAGLGRSGSTILGQILNSVSGFFLVGELNYIWERGLLENRLCSCGVPFNRCPLWLEVMKRAFGGIDQVDAKKSYTLNKNGLRTRHLLPTFGLQSPEARIARMGEYPQNLEKLYHAVQSVSQSRVIVDTSKWPADAYLLGAIPSIELYVLHLVRDPRGAAYSWARREKREYDQKRQRNYPMPPVGVARSSLHWSEFNFVLERHWRRETGRRLLLRYEDFAKSPQGSVEKILEFCGEKGARVPFVREREVYLTESHTFSGNPSRLYTGTTTIEVDEEWKRKMSLHQMMLVTLLSWPGLRRYGYPLWPR